MPGHISKSRAIIRRYRCAGIVAGALLLMPGKTSADVTQQCTVQSSYPSPLDQNGDPIGALLKVDLVFASGIRIGRHPSSRPQQDRDLADGTIG